MNRNSVLVTVLFFCVSLSCFGQQIKLLEQHKAYVVFSNLESDIEIVDVQCLQETILEPAIKIAEDKLEISNLAPGCVYEVGFKDHDQNWTQYFTTQSESTGDIKIYFNYEMPQWQSSQLVPDGTSFGIVEKALKDLIRSAEETIDYCAYNTNVASIVNELIDAKARGVRVRAIVESDNNNSAFDGGVPFEVLKDRNNKLMHNKFIIVDADSQDPNKPYVVNGSMNFTQGQMASDPNHLMIIQDQALARAYRMEFEEMWGSDTDQFDIGKAKFGSSKSDNTPHDFLIGDIPCNLYFSPSDKTSGFIEDAIMTADYDIDIGLLIFTYWDLRDALKLKVQEGIRVRGIVNDQSSSGAVVSELNSAGANIQYHTNGRIYHHKMAIIDGEYPNSDPMLVSGSHNWTYTAETANDENTMIFKDASLAELFKRAFSAEWKKLSTNINEPEFKKLYVSPNPTAQSISFGEKLNGFYSIINQNGQLLIAGKVSENIDVSYLASGTYFIQVEAGIESYQAKFIKI